MVRPALPDEVYEKFTKSNKPRDPWEYDSELAKYKAISDFMALSGDLSDTNDAFKTYEAKLLALNEITGFDCSLRLIGYRNYKRTSPDRGRLSRGELTRLLSQPRIVVHGNDLINPEVKEKGIIASIIDGAKRTLGMQTEETRTVQNVQQ